MKLAKRFFATFLCLVTILTIVPLDVFAEDDVSQSNLEETDIRVQSTNSLGKEINNLMEDQNEQENEDYVISWLDVQGKTATVEMYNKNECTVVVAIFKENGKMVGSGTAQVEAGTADAIVELNIEKMPEYFVAEVYLLDENMASLCEEYYCERYTQSFREFLELTVDDFEEQIVVQFEEEVEDNNFVVAKDGTQEAEQTGDKNILVSADHEEGIFVFENADETITGVSAGENLFYDLGNKEYILVKVASNVTEGNLTTVVADDAEISDLYDCIKLDTTSDTADATVDTSTMDDAFELVETEPKISNRAIDVEVEKKVNFSLMVDYETPKKTLKVSGGFDFQVGVKIKLYYKVKLFKKDQIDFKLEAKYKYGYKLDIEAGIDTDVKLPLPEITIPVYAGIFFKVGMQFNISAKGSVGIEGYKYVVTGFTYDNKNGRNKIHEEKDNWTPINKGIGFEVSFSLEVKAALSALEVIEAGLSVEVGIALEGTIDIVKNQEGEEVRHLCTTCVDGEFFVFIKVKISMSAGYKRLKVQLFSVVVAEWKFKLFDFYFSDISSGVFATCPNYEYKVTFRIYDESGKRLEGAKVGDMTTDENGLCYFYSEPNKEHTIDISLDGYLNQRTTVKVEKTAKEVPVRMTAVKITGISVKALPSKTSYYTGDTLDTAGLVLTAKYNNEKTETITSGYSCTPEILNNAGTQAVTVTYKGRTTKYNVSVTQTKPTSISVATKPDKLSYFVGDTLDASGLVLNEKYNNGDVITITDGYTCTPSVLNTSGTQTITVKYGNNICTYTVDVKPVVATGISVSELPDKLEYFVGDELYTGGLVLTETYNNGKTADITSGYTCTPAVFETSGIQTVTVTYNGNTCTYSVNVFDVEDYTGSCGTNLTWEFEPENGVLTIKGTGEMDLWNSKSDVPWHTYRSDIKEIVVEDGVTTISNNAFINCQNLISVKIGNTVTSLGNSAFYHCDSLVSIEIPDSVTSIGSSAFSYCSSLATIEIPDGVTSIEFCAFSDCTSLTSVTIPYGVTMIGNSAFYDCTSLTSVTIPYSVTMIGNSAFSGCTSLISVAIPDSVAMIGSGAFTWCDSLTTVYYSGNEMQWNEIQIDPYDEPFKNAEICFESFPYDDGDFEYEINYDGVTITSYTGTDAEVIIPSTIVGYPVRSIGYRAFRGCRSLASVTIPRSVTSIDSDAFYNCTRLTSIIIPDSVISIGSYAFYNCTALISITIGEVQIYEGAFENCDSLVDVYYTGDIESWCKISFDDIFGNPMYYAENFYINNTLVKELVIPDTVTRIYSWTFYSFECLTSVTIPDSVTGIDEGAFYDCKNLSSVTIGNGIEYIIEFAFSGCESLTDVYYSGTEEEWNEITIYEANRCLTSATIHYNSIGPESVSVAKARNYAMPVMSSYSTDAVVTAQTSGAIVGNRYTLIALDQQVTEYDLNALAFIDHTLATCEDVSFSFIPKSAENLIVLIIGDFGSGIEQRVISGEPGIDVTDIQLSRISVVLHPDNEIQLSAYITPENASIQTVAWSSDNASVAFVDKEGVVTACKEGEATITATASNGITAECTIIVGHTTGIWGLEATESGDKLVKTCTICGEITEEKEVLENSFAVLLKTTDGKAIDADTVLESETVCFENVENGNYVLTVSKTGYTSKKYNVEATDNSVSCDNIKLNHIGDINGDGKVNTIDVARANSHAKSVTLLSDYAFECADVNGDGKVNTIDVARMNSHAKGVTTLW